MDSGPVRPEGPPGVTVTVLRPAAELLLCSLLSGVKLTQEDLTLLLLHQVFHLFHCYLETVTRENHVTSRLVSSVQIN